MALLCRDLPPLPHFSRFHDAFRLLPAGTTREGDIRKAYFLAYEEERVEYVDLAEASRLTMSGRALVSANFVTPYPPGFPILVPGQIVNEELLAFMRALDVKEIHGYRPELGLRVFTEAALAAATAKH